jgi:hypothetical protein
MQNRLALLAIPAVLFAGTAIAQDVAAQPEPAPLQYDEIWEAWTPTWSSPAIEGVANAIIGSWKTAAPVAEAGEDAGGSTDMLMTVSAAPVQGVADALYVEQYRADSPGTPFRQSVMQIYKFKDGHRLRTYEIMGDDARTGVLIGMGHLPEAFPELSRDELIATLDLDISPSGNGFKGRTPYPYPTGTGGAVEMTSEIAVDGDRMTTADRGFGADGSVVWGAGESASYNWTKTEDWASVERREGGLALITFTNPDDDKPVDGGRIFVHYTGWTVDGNKFDSSIDKGQPWPLQWPVSQVRVIEGWKQGFDGVTKGTVRKIVIPPDLAYGANGVPRAGIGPNATLYFNTEVITVQAPPPAPEDTPAGPEAEAGQD